MNKHEIKKQFDNLGSASKLPDGYSYDSVELKNMSRVFLAKSSSGAPLILIEVDSAGSEKIPAIQLENIQITPASPGVLGKSTEVRDYYILEFKGISSDLISIFFEITALLPDLLQSERSRLKVHKTVTSVIELFSDEYRERKKSVAGLWGELFVINESDSSTEFVRAWHSSEFERFDFYLPKTVVEVKVSLKGTRTHSISHAQLESEPAKATFMASIITQESPTGKSLEEMKDSIIDSLSDASLKQKVISIIAMTIGTQNLHLLQRRFDEDMARDSLRLFDTKRIPRVSSPLPIGVSNLKYDVSLDLVVPESRNLQSLT